MHAHPSGVDAAIAAELVLLSALAGTLGVWVVLRRLAFFAHAVGTAAFPGIVIAGSLGGLGSALLAGAGVRGLRGAPRLGADAATGLVLAVALAVGAIAAADSGEHPEEILFGSLRSAGWGEVAWTAGALALMAVAEALRGRRWLADGLDGRAPDLLLLGCIALAAVAAVDAVGALLVAAILVIPAATARLLTDDLVTLRVLAAAIALGEGAAALVVGQLLDADTGGVMAVLGGLGFAAAQLVRRPA